MPSSNVINLKEYYHRIRGIIVSSNRDSLSIIELMSLLILLLDFSKITPINYLSKSFSYFVDLYNCEFNFF